MDSFCIVVGSPHGADSRSQAPSDLLFAKTAPPARIEMQRVRFVMKGGVVVGDELTAEK
jgi:hypothetical protein